MTKHVDTLIVGGGIIGHSISYYLNKAGLSTWVVEKSRSGQKATRAAAGMLGVHTENKTPGSYHQFCEKSRNLYSDLSTELRDVTGIDIGLSRFGMLEVAMNTEHKKELLKKQEAFPYLSWVNAEELSHYGLSEPLGALHMGGDGHVEPVRVCEAFRQAALSYGGKVIEDCAVTGCRKVEHAFEVSLDSDLIKARQVVVASGAESGKWFEETGLANPMVPTKGECFSITPTQSYFKETLFFHHFYVVPKPDGRYVIGATSIPNDTSSTTTAGGLSTLMNEVFAVLPELQKEPFHKYWSGVRPGTVDGLPVIGEHPDLAGLYFATGHYRNGILLAPATGELIRDLILERDVSELDHEMFSPRRFQLKGGKQVEYSSEWKKLRIT